MTQEPEQNPMEAGAHDHLSLARFTQAWQTWSAEALTQDRPVGPYAAKRRAQKGRYYRIGEFWPEGSLSWN